MLLVLKDRNMRMIVGGFTPDFSYCIDHTYLSTICQIKHYLYRLRHLCNNHYTIVHVLQTSLQARIVEIQAELSELVTRQDELKTRMRLAREAGELARLDTLRSQLESFAAVQLRLRMEQSAIIGGSSKHK